MPWSPGYSIWMVCDKQGWQEIRAWPFGHLTVAHVEWIPCVFNKNIMLHSHHWILSLFFFGPMHYKHKPYFTFLKRKSWINHLTIAFLGVDADCSLWSSRFPHTIYVAPAPELFLLAMPAQPTLQVPDIERTLQADRWKDMDAWLQSEKG